jgi:hypothetical protein
VLLGEVDQHATAVLNVPKRSPSMGRSAWDIAFAIMRRGDPAVGCRPFHLGGDLVKPLSSLISCICHIRSIRTAVGMIVHSSGNTK